MAQHNSISALGTISAWGAFGTTRAWFVALVTYYLFALYLVPSSAIVDRFSITYFAIILPAWLYVAGNWKYLLSGYTLASKSLALFAILTTLIGLLRWDISIAYNAIFLSAMAIIILHSRVYLTIVELNWMFLGTVIGSVAVYYLEITDYGFLPGQAQGEGCHISMNWRISLFRLTAESAMFSFVILFANIIYGDRLRWWIRGLVIFVATYFLIYSGVRSVVLPALPVIAICAIVALYRLSPKGRRHALAGIAAGAIAILSVPYWLGSSDGFWENYFLKTKTCDYLVTYGYVTPSGAPTETTSTARRRSIPPEWYGRTFNRHCSAMYQLSIFARSPFGNRDIQPKSDQQLKTVGCPAEQQLYFYCDSCNIATYWLARAGVAAVPLALFFLTLTLGALICRNTELFLILTLFGVVSLSWGVMFVPYNFIFLLMLAMPAIVFGLRNHRENV